MTNAELAILHLLAEKPRHGYEIEEVIEQRGMREWTAVGFSSIYYLLNKLAGKDLVEKRAEPAARGPDRKVFNLTAAGYQALHQGALAALADHASDDQTWLMGLANLPLLTQPEALAALARHRDGLLERRQHIVDRRQAQRPAPAIAELLFNYSLAMLDARRQWLDAFIQDIESGRFSSLESRDRSLEPRDGWPAASSPQEKNDDDRYQD